MSRSGQGVVGLCLLMLPLSAPAKENSPAPKPKPAEVTAVFRDGSVLKGVTLSGSVELTTRYGKLTIPLEDVKRVDFAFRVSETEGRKLAQAIAALRSEQVEERTEARRKLIGLGRKAAMTPYILRRPLLLMQKAEAPASFMASVSCVECQGVLEIRLA